MGAKPGWNGLKSLPLDSIVESGPISVFYEFTIIEHPLKNPENKQRQIVSKATLRRMSKKIRHYAYLREPLIWN